MLLQIALIGIMQMLAPKSGKVDVCECEARMKDAIGAC